jgi:predicted membrane channel-forming protein YqfA (hemolysin III family)
MEHVKSCLNQQAKQGNIQMMLKDLSAINIALLRYLASNRCYTLNHPASQEIQRVSRTFWHIKVLQETLETASRSMK